MPSVAICSMFRDSQIWHGREIHQVEKFYNRMRVQNFPNPHYYFVEGNSKDNTAEALRWQFSEEEMKLFNYSVSGNEVASLESETRFKNLSRLGNTVLIPARDDGHDLVFWMESDLIAPSDLYKRLVSIRWSDIDWTRCLGVAPVPVFKRGDSLQFYDTWAFARTNGTKFKAHEISEFQNWQSKYMEVSSLGSCVLFNGKLLRQHKLDMGDGCLPELCRRGREVGLSLYVDTTLMIEHPSNELVASRLI